MTVAREPATVVVLGFAVAVAVLRVAVAEATAHSEVAHT